MTEFNPRTITKLLNEAGQGDERARDKLVEIIYPDLVVQARKRLRREPLLKAKAPESLVHDVLFGKLPQEKQDWQCRKQFYGYAKRAMWQVCLGEVRRILKERKLLPPGETSTWGIGLQEIRDIEEALGRLEKAFRNGPRLVQVVRLRFIEQRSVAETAQILKVSKGTVVADWRFARAWLHRELSKGDSTTDLVPAG